MYQQNNLQSNFSEVAQSLVGVDEWKLNFSEFHSIDWTEFQPHCTILCWQILYLLKASLKVEYDFT